MELGLFLLRVVIGALFIGHGTRKLFGWLGGPGQEGNTQRLASLGFRKPHALSRLHGGTEAAAGVLLVLGLLTPFAAAGILGVMMTAILVVHLPNGPWVQDGGYEFPLVLATAAILFGFAGPGLLAIDPVIGILPGLGWGLVTLVLGLLGALAVLTTREITPEEAEADDEVSAEDTRAA
jgi:putative oxidoreductase